MRGGLQNGGSRPDSMMPETTGGIHLGGPAGADDSFFCRSAERGLDRAVLLGRRCVRQVVVPDPEPPLLASWIEVFGIGWIAFSWLLPRMGI